MRKLVLVQVQTQAEPVPLIYAKCDWCGKMEALQIWGSDVICRPCFDGRDGQEPWLEFERRKRG